jgi:hypothetical protein
LKKINYFFPKMITQIVIEHQQELPYTKSDAIAEWLDEDRWTKNHILQYWYDKCPDLPRGLLYGEIHDDLDSIYEDGWRNKVTPDRYLAHIRQVTSPSLLLSKREEK